jgi:doublecortin-like kinase 1/2
MACIHIKVGCLADFFGPDFIFIAYGNEKFSHDDFDLTSNGIYTLNLLLK